MTAIDAEQLVREFLAGIDQPGGLERFVQDGLLGTIDEEILNEACETVTKTLLESEDPKTGPWEHFLVTLAVHSCQSQAPRAMEPCRATIRTLRAMVSENRFVPSDPRKAITVTTALTLVLTAQPKLKQPVEEAIKLLCEKYAHLLPQIAQQCQELWIRRGQMTGGPGLFLWDLRNGEWRLAQDFKPIRPDRGDTD